MPAHANVRPRSVGLTVAVPRRSPAVSANAERSAPKRNARGRKGDLELLEWFHTQLRGADHLCTVTDNIAKGLAVAGETVRQRLLRLSSDGTLTIAPCSCAAMAFAHRRFRLGGAKTTGAPAPAAVVVAAPVAAAVGGTSKPTAVAASGGARTDAGDEALRDWLRDQIGTGTHVCLTNDPIAASLGVAGRTVFRRLDRLKAAGRIDVAACNCAALPNGHRRFTLGGAVAVAPAAVAVPRSARALRSVLSVPAAAAVPPALAASAVPALAAAPVAAAPVAAAVPVGGLRQLVAAAPDTWALFRDGVVLWREPVAAWGLWDANGVGVAGPLVFQGAGLQPAATIAGYAGVRIGAYRCVGESRTYDGTAGYEVE